LQCALPITLDVQVRGLNDVPLRSTWSTCVGEAPFAFAFACAWLVSNIFEESVTTSAMRRLKV
jgi:hypothetical protein